jgi:hypothetical protein
MKNLTLIGNEWKQRVSLALSAEERALLLTSNKDKRDARNALAKRIAAESFIAATPEDAAAAQALYDATKIEGADFISADVSLPDGTGIINCRMSGKHQQIRF